MNLTAHPFTVLAELQWKQESLGGANRATTASTHARQARVGGGRAWRRFVRRPTPRPRHTPRPV